VREDFLDEKKALDEVEPYIFGIPQMVERDSFDRAKTTVTSVHEDCLAARREWMHLFFGDKPDMEEVLRWNILSNSEKFQEGILRLRNTAQYEPTANELLAGSFRTDKSFSNLIDCSCCEHENESLPLHLSDIYQRYAESCYDPYMINIASAFDDDVKTLSNNSSNVENLDGINESQRREIMYRVNKIKSHLHSSNNGRNQESCNQKNQHAICLTIFDGLLDRSAAMYPMFSSNDEDTYETSPRLGYKDAIMQYAKEKLSEQHQRVCHKFIDIKTQGVPT
jgi:hypothetical protein